MSLGRRLIWLGILGMLMQLGLGLTWLACVSLAVGQLTAARPELQKLTVQAQQTLSTLTPSTSDEEKLFEIMAPIFSQMNWHLIALITGVLAFGALGYIYARLTGSIDFLGALPIISLFSRQNPITMAMAFAGHGVTQARFSHAFEVVLLLTQLLSLYGCGAVGVWLYQRKQARRPSVTTR